MQKKKIDPKVLKTVLIYAAVETAIVAILVTADILTKYFAFLNIGLGEEIPYLGGFLTITAVKNTGASFGIFGSSTVALTIVSLVCSLLIYGFSIYTERTRTPLLRAALALVLAGAVGNLIDRMFLGYVRDMIHLSIFPWVFNVADTYLTVGVILILIYVVFFYSRDKERADKRKAIAPASSGAPTAEGLRVAEEGEVSIKIDSAAPNSDASDQNAANADSAGKETPNAEASNKEAAKVETAQQVSAIADASIIDATVADTSEEARATAEAGKNTVAKTDAKSKDVREEVRAGKTEKSGADGVKKGAGKAKSKSRALPKTVNNVAETDSGSSKQAGNKANRDKKPKTERGDGV